jgi:hypothetical protein
MNGAYVALFASVVAMFLALVTVFAAKKKRGGR